MVVFRAGLDLAKFSYEFGMSEVGKLTQEFEVEVEALF
jgi:hypothetical protein